MKEKLKTPLKKKDVPEFRKIVTKLGLISLALCFLQIALAFIGTIFNLDNYKEFYGSIYLIFCVISIAIIYKLNKNFVFDNERKVQSMKPMTFVRCFCSMMSLMLVFTAPTIILDVVLNQFGYTVLDVASANSFSDSITQFIYVSFLGPICEEVIFRGMIQKSLQKFTPFIAILTSSVMFGIYHGNFGQMFQATGVGIVLGYVAYRYSMKWSIAMHIVYNLFIGELFGLLSEILSKNGEEYLLPIIEVTPFNLVVSILAAAGFVFICIQLFLKKNFLQKYNVKFHKLLIPFTSIGLIFFTLYNLITSILLIVPM